MTVGDSQKLGITVKPEGASQDVIFESSDKEIVTERVYIASGTYEETITIAKSGLTVCGPNAGINPNKQSKGEEAVIKGQITIAAGTSNVVINGLAFTEGSKVRVEQGTDNIELSYNNIYDTNDGGDGLKVENKLKLYLIYGHRLMMEQKVLI